MRAYGLQTHIWNNNLKSAFLLAGFPLLMVLLTYGLFLLWVGATEDFASPAEGMALALSHLAGAWPFAVGAALLWFAVAWMFHQAIIDASVGARGIERREAPELYNLLENLCIARGMAVPKLNIIDTPAMNAFASGLTEKGAAVTVTRGLIEALDKPEIEAVLAHELTHIRNRDVRLLVIAVIFVGIFSFVGEIIYRGFFQSGVRIGGHTRSRNGDSRGGGVLILAALAIIAVAYVLAIVIRFSLSQKREFLADAGSVDLTKNPDAMISALMKISGRSEVDAPNDVQQMMLDSDAKFAGIFATHPSIEQRVAALRDYAGGA